MKFVDMFTSDFKLSSNLVYSGMTFYLYNELATMTIKKTSAVTASVANTAKRVIVMVVSAIVFGEVMTFEAKVGATVAISGVFLNSMASQIEEALFGKPDAKKTTEADDDHPCRVW